MDLKDIKAIYKFFKGTDLTEITVERDGGKVKFKRGAEESAPVRVATSPAEASAPKVHAKEITNQNLKTILSPMVGTFYRAASPEGQPFVEAGSVIKKGQAVCIIEAMKLMNEIESEYSGKIIAVLVDNGQPVEYGEPLFTVEISK